MIIAIEGTSFVGKSVLVEQLKGFLGQREYLYFADYVEAIRNTRPSEEIPPGLLPTIENQIEATKQFLRVETDRFNLAIQEDDSRIIIVDRSIFTLIGHAYAIEFGYSQDGLYDQISRLVFEWHRKLTPTHLIVLTVPQIILERRYPPKKTKNVFMSQQYNYHFNQYLENLEFPRKLVISGAQSIRGTLQLVVDFITPDINDSRWR